MNDISSLTKKFGSLSQKTKKIIISSISTVCIIGIGFGIYIVYTNTIDAHAKQKIEELSRDGITVTSCSEIQNIHISQLKRTSNNGSIVDMFNSLKNGCTQIRGDFGILGFFNPENDFRSTFVINYSTPVYPIKDTVGTDKYKQKESEAKNLILSQLHFSPSVDISTDDIDIYDKKIVLSANLNPETDYTLKIDHSVLNNEGRSINSWDFKTPENKTFQLRMKDKVTLFNTLHTPSVELLAYNTEKTSTKIKVCRLGLENYAKTEVMLKSQDVTKINTGTTMSGEATFVSKKLNPQEEFFYSGIDSLKNEGCREMGVEIAGNGANQKKLIKKDIPLGETLKDLGTTGLFVILFSDVNDRHYNDHTQAPLLFGSINAHTTMKVSQNGEAFFFVNDFSGKPLEGVELSVGVNEFSSQETTYVNGFRNVIQKSPLDKNIYSKQISLGKTNKDGILKTNFKGKIDDYFGKTFENSYEFEESGKYTSFFVTAKSGENLSYVSSQWNGGIAPWNFGYSVNSWYDSANLNGDNLSVNQWNGDDIPFVSHVFTDRVLYLPGESVSIKGIIRKSLNLSTPKNEKFTLSITDNQGKEVKRTPLRSNEFGSIIDTFVLSKEVPLGVYNVVLLASDEREIGRTNFSVEVFKNPKFTTDIKLTTTGLNGEMVNIDSKKKVSDWYMRNEYSGKFTIQANLIGRYYSGGILGEIPFNYKVYRQEYYDSSYWTDCYYGCFWEPNKEFYTEGTGTFDGNGAATLDIPVEFKSSYSDYRYIVEVTPRDTTGDTISSTNAIIARLPSELKMWDPNTAITFSTEKRFYPADTEVSIQGKINHGTWDENQENKYLLIVKKKTFEVKEVMDVRGFKRPVTTPKEALLEIIPVSKKRFTIDKNGTVELKYKLPETAEYIFEFGSVDSTRLTFTNVAIEDLISEFNYKKELSIQKNVTLLADGTTDYWALSSRCVGSSESCSYESLIRQTGCDTFSNEACLREGNSISLEQKINVDDLVTGRQFFSIITYSDTPAKNPVVSDNKIQVLSEKVSYKIGEKARILVRLPFSKGKILWTVEKRGVEKYEYIDVPGNIFFREVTVDESFTPNGYIGVVAVDTNTEKVPEYKVGYTEIVVDKTDKKATVTVAADKKIYAPRDKVSLSIQVRDAYKKGRKNELTVMVVDDSLISLMGNIDTNTLEKIWKKLSFQIQTSITNIAMLKNYYFGRPGIVGGSGSDNNKGGDSAKSSRNIFKNTAYYNAHVVTDDNGDARVDFTLPDNLTQFRVMVVSNSEDNVFGSGETLFSVQKPVTLEDKTPLILRNGDEITIGANVFNQTGKDMSFVVKINSDNLSLGLNHKEITLKSGENAFVTFEAKAKNNNKDIYYSMSAVGDSTKNSDGIDGKITLAESPTLTQYVLRDDILSQTTRDYTITVPENTLVSRSSYEISLSNNPIQHLESIISSLLIYPYGCIEQSVSTTVPNVMAKKFAQYFTNSKIDIKKSEEQTKVGLARIASMQVDNGGFAYWQGSSSADLHITPYVLRSLIEMRDLGAPVDQTMIDRTINYLTNELTNPSDNTQKTEIFQALARAGKGQLAYDIYFSNTEIAKELTRHERIAYLYGLFLTDKTKYRELIKTNIELVKKDFSTTKNDNYWENWYWNQDSDKAIFASFLMDANYDEIYVTKIIKELSSKDYVTYYMSTQSKNAAFGAFIKYIEKYGKNRTSNVQITLGDAIQDVTLSGNGGSFTRKFLLSEVSQNGKIPLTIQSDDKTPVFVNVRLSAYPQDILKVKKYENGIKLSRIIEEVVDTKKLAECSNYYYQDEHKCDDAFKGVDGVNFKKGSTYKITLKAIFTDDKNQYGIHRNFTFEDYLPATFRVMNSKFRTNTIATNQNTTEGWYYDHIEVLPSVIMSHSENVWGNTAEYSYFVTPEFTGTFTYPPVSAYLMYNPDIRSSGEFQIIKVK